MGDLSYFPAAGIKKDSLLAALCSLVVLRLGLRQDAWVVEQELTLAITAARPDFAAKRAPA
jgi:hypothetical protein